VESVEASGKSIEDAILQALVRLGRNRDEVDIQILQEPSRGVRGMGVREARVRVVVRPPRAGQGPGRGPGTSPDGGMRDEHEADGYPDEEGYGEDEYYEPYEEPGSPAAGFAVAPELLARPLKDVLPEDASIEEMAVAALQTILALMGMPADIEVAEPINPEAEDEEPLTLNIRGTNDQILSLLIGRRGETLASLQLLVNLAVAKQTGHHERIIVDAEGYRARREDNLRAMAQRVAAQVRRSGSPIMLEAMPPNERRIIHMALAESQDVSTESTGEGDQRRVVISLKRPMRGGRTGQQGQGQSPADQG
jgi:spoIIIJ-associated protein